MSALLGMLTGIGGGMMRDVLLTEIPQVLRSDLYAVAALAGAAIVVVGHMSGLSYGVSAPVGGALCFGLRFMAIRYGWQLPVGHLSARGRADRILRMIRKDRASSDASVPGQLSQRSMRLLSLWNCQHNGKDRNRYQENVEH